MRKDGTVSYLGQRFEVPYVLSGKTVMLVVDPHAGAVVDVEDEAGASLGKATPLDTAANLTRTRHKSGDVPVSEAVKMGPKLVEIAFQQYHDTREG